MEHRKIVADAMDVWESREERLSWGASQIREKLISEATVQINGQFALILTCVAISPLLGLLGTVTGMIVSFSGLADGGGVSGSGGEVAEGIAEALVTTAVGLIIALSAVIPQSVFNRWSDEIELEIEESSTELIEHILTHH